MAEKLESFEFVRGTADESYPWADWEDGIWEVKRGEDYTTSTASFIGRLHTHAAGQRISGRANLRVRTKRVDDDTIVFEFYAGRRNRSSLWW